MSLCDVEFNVLVVLKLHTGAFLSLHTAVIDVACVIVTVVGLAVRLAGVFPLFLIHPLKTYPLAVLHVALILTHELYLYVHAPFTLDTHVHAVKLNAYVFLVYQHAYVVLAAFAVVAPVAAVQLGFQILVICLVLRVHGDVHRFANVKLVHHDIT